MLNKYIVLVIINLFTYISLMADNNMLMDNKIYLTHLNKTEQNYDLIQNISI